MIAQADNGRFLAASIPVIEELEGHLQCRLNGRVSNLQIVLRPNGLILRGRSHTYYAKQLALQALLEATDQPILANDIEVI
jgi:hypothetical protein